jgi:hypothetical protein
MYNGNVDKDTSLTPERSGSPNAGCTNGSPQATGEATSKSPTAQSAASNFRVNVTPQLRMDLAKFAFKLAYLYFNTLSPVKVPAPVHYATRLCTMLANISTRESGNVIPHVRAENLFFI